DFHVTGVQTCALPISPDFRKSEKNVQNPDFPSCFRSKEPVSRPLVPYGRTSAIKCRRAIHRLLNVNSVSNCAVFFASPRYLVVQIGRASCREREYIST